MRLETYAFCLGLLDLFSISGYFPFSMKIKIPISSVIAILYSATHLLFSGCNSWNGNEGGQKNSSGDPIFESAYEKHLEIQERMKTKGQTRLHIAAEDEDKDEMLRLLEKGSRPDVRDYWQRTPLHLAAEHGNIEIVKILLEKGADVNAKTKLGETPIFFALRCVLLDEDEPNTEIWTKLAEILLSAGAEIKISSTKGLTPLHLAVSAREGSPEIVRKLIQMGADVNAAEEFGDTVLHFATRSEKTENAKILLEAGANVHAVGRFGNTPLHSAAWKQKAPASLVKLFVDAKADVNAKNSVGETAVHIAADGGNKEFLRELLDAGGNPNEKSNDGKTPLHKAAANVDVEIIQILIDRKADINSFDNEGWTPLDYAKNPKEAIFNRGKPEDCIELLLKYGGKSGDGKKP